MYQLYSSMSIYLDLEAPSGHVVDEVVRHSSQIVSRASRQIDLVGPTEAAEELVFIKMARQVIRKQFPTETLQAPSGDQVSEGEVKSGGKKHGGRRVALSNAPGYVYFGTRYAMKLEHRGAGGEVFSFDSK